MSALTIQVISVLKLTLKLLRTRTSELLHGILMLLNPRRLLVFSFIDILRDFVLDMVFAQFSFQVG